MVRSVLAVGPNPALQRVLAFDQLALGGVNRASAHAGSGWNVCQG